MDYVIYLYGVKHSTVSNTNYAIQSLSCLLSFYTIPISLIFKFNSSLVIFEAGAGSYKIMVLSGTGDTVAGSGHLILSAITKYGSNLYIGMDEVLAHYACTFENSNLHFHFQL